MRLGSVACGAASAGTPAASPAATADRGGGAGGILRERGESGDKPAPPLMMALGANGGSIGLTERPQQIELRLAFRAAILVDRHRHSPTSYGTDRLDVRQGTAVSQEERLKKRMHKTHLSGGLGVSPKKALWVGGSEEAGSFMGCGGNSGARSGVT